MQHYLEANMNGEKSTFIKIDKFETAMSVLLLVKKKLSEAQATLDKINSLKQEEDIAVEKWASDLASIKTKLDNIESELTSEEEHG